MLSSMRKAYPTDLSYAEWTRLQSYLPPPKAQGRLRTHSLRDVLDAIFYVLKSGCHWRLLPHDFPPWSTVYYHFRRFRMSGLWSLILKALRAAARKRVGKDPQPTAAIMDSQSVKTIEERRKRERPKRGSLLRVGPGRSERWKVERTFAWLGSLRRLLVRHEHYPSIFRAFFLVAFIISLRRL